MQFWWVNQKQTWKQELDEGCLWSPKRKSNGAKNPYYEFMRGVSPGDLVFSYVKKLIPRFAVARSYAYEAPKPLAFGRAGERWGEIGWRVDVEYFPVAAPIAPQEHIDRLRPLLPERYAPLQQDGLGMQNMYLTRLPEELGLELARLGGGELRHRAQGELVAESPVSDTMPEVEAWEDHLRKQIEGDPSLDQTERKAIVQARRGQGQFRQRVQRFEWRCRVTGVDRVEHLRASHCKPWRSGDNQERLDGANGLLLTPSIDHLFDRGFISFERSGRLLISPTADRPSLAKMGVPMEESASVGEFSAEQDRYLEYHRDLVFLRPQVAG